MSAEPLAARVAAAIFAGEALILLAVALLYRSGLGSSGRVAIPAACGALAVLLFVLAERMPLRLLQFSVALGTVLVSLHAWAAQNEPALSGEMLYIWLGLFAAYFFTPRHAATQLAFMAAAYLAVLIASVRVEAVPAAWLTLVGILFPAAGLLRAMRDGVTQLVERLSEAALTDTLTGLKNRLALDEELHAEVERALRSEKPLSLVIGDLDYFKAVNDRLGHRAGDEALVRAGSVLLRHRRAGDSIARTGGEEFTILLPGASEHEAYLVSERMRSAVEHEFGESPVGLTFSFGDRHLPEPRPFRGRGARGGRPGPVRGEGARAQPLRDLQPGDLDDLRAGGRARR